MLISTSRKPSQKTRKFCKNLAHATGSTNVNRGKSNMRELLLKALELDEHNLAIVNEIKGNPSRVTFYSNKGEILLIILIGVTTSNERCHILPKNLKIVSKSSEPLFKSLAYTFSPPLPGITGDLEGSTEFLEKMNLSYGIKFTDLGEEEKDILKDELIKINPDIFGDCYTVPKEIPLLRDLEEYSYILDACGKNKKFGLGLSIALGEREKALKTATDLQRKYRDQLVKGLEWIKREGSVNLSHIQYLYSEDKVLKSVMGTIASIGLSINLLDDSKPVLGLSRLHKDIKVSGRTTRQQVEKGVNLGKALQDSSNNFGGQGGGHDIAAGAMIPFDSKDNFLNLVNDMVEYQINND